MLKELFSKQSTAVDYFFSHLALSEAEQLLDHLANSKGTVIFTGVGKSGLVAEKLAMTMVSTGVRSWYLPPMNALHGDLGIVNKGDQVVLLSKSGESDELLQLVPFLRNKGASLIAWVCGEGSRLEKACDMTIHLPLKSELCPFDLAPTTSDVLQLIFGNVLAVALMEVRHFSLDDYARNHPAGRIGKRITMRVRDLMLTGKDLPTCSPESQIVDQLVTLSDKRCGCLLVVDQSGHLAGIFTDGDLRRALQKEGGKTLNRPVEEVMTRKFRSIDHDAMAYDAMKVMEADQKHPVTVLPVLEGDQLRGLVRLHDILQTGL
jgi:arabinose-5-phosphate isomerase